MKKLCHIKRDRSVNFICITLENAKNRDVRAIVWPIYTKFVTLMQNMSLKCTTVKNFNFKKPRWRTTDALDSHSASSRKIAVLQRLRWRQASLSHCTSVYITMQRGSASRGSICYSWFGTYGHVSCTINDFRFTWCQIFDTLLTSEIIVVYNSNTPRQDTTVTHIYGKKFS